MTIFSAFSRGGAHSWAEFFPHSCKLKTVRRMRKVVFFVVVVVIARVSLRAHLDSFLKRWFSGRKTSGFWRNLPFLVKKNWVEPDTLCPSHRQEGLEDGPVSKPALDDRKLTFSRHLPGHLTTISFKGGKNKSWNFWKSGTRSSWNPWEQRSDQRSCYWGKYQPNTTSCPLGRLSSERWKRARTGETGEKLEEPLGTAGGSVKWCSCRGQQSGSSLKS